MSRIKEKQGREEGISEEYIRDLHKHHTEWLEGEKNVLRLNGNIDINDENYNQLILNVVNFIENKVEKEVSLSDEMDIEWYGM